MAIRILVVCQWSLNSCVMLVFCKNLQLQKAVTSKADEKTCGPFVTINLTLQHSILALCNKMMLNYFNIEKYAYTGLKKQHCHLKTEHLRDKAIASEKSRKKAKMTRCVVGKYHFNKPSYALCSNLCVCEESS